MRIALLGGSFNPIHVGHVAIAQAVLSQRLADEAWLVVSPQNPLKQQHNLLPETIRLRWAQVAVEPLPGIEASDVEFRLPRPSYTYQTLRHLRQERPADEFILCIGADNWERFAQWRATDEIMAHHDIIVYPREGSPLSDLPLYNPTAVTTTTHRQGRIYCPLVNVSSTLIRQRLQQGLSVEGLVPANLITIIQAEWKNL